MNSRNISWFVRLNSRLIFSWVLLLWCDFSFFFFSEQQSVVSTHESLLWIMMSSRGYMCGKSSRYWDLRLLIINFQWLRVGIRCHGVECNVKKSEIFEGVVSLQLHPPLLCVSQIRDFSRFSSLSQFRMNFVLQRANPNETSSFILLRFVHFLCCCLFFSLPFSSTCQTQILTPSSYRPAQSRCIQRAKMKLEKNIFGVTTEKAE